jgi:hypothetical protein
MFRLSYMLGNDLLIEKWIAPTVIDPDTRAVIQTGQAYQEVVPH